MVPFIQALRVCVSMCAHARCASTIAPRALLGKHKSRTMQIPWLLLKNPQPVKCVVGRGPGSAAWFQPR